MNGLYGECSDMVATAENSSGKVPLISSRNVRHGLDEFNECHRRFITATSPGNPGSDGAGADVLTVPDFNMNP